MRVAKKYGPEQDGAKRFARRYGDQLVCVRHRVSEDGLTRFTTVELLAETTPIAIRQRSMIALRLPAAAKSTRSLLLACGATWDAKNRVWLLPHMVANPSSTPIVDFERFQRLEVNGINKLAA
jgi:hypothetical protein